MFKPKAKITVRCPHCSFEQSEPPMVRSTYCRRCSEYFSVDARSAAGSISGSVPGAPPPARGPRLVNPAVPPPAVVPPPAPAVVPRAEDEAASQARVTIPSAPPPPAIPAPASFAEPPAPVPGEAAEERSSLRERLGLWIGTPPKSQTVRCFECNGAQEVSGAAQSTICKDCGAYVDLQDYKISGSFSRNIVTRGVVQLGKTGDLSSSKLVCAAATLHGRMRGNLVCSGKVIIRFRGKMPGSLEAGYLLVEKGSELDFVRPVRVGAVEIHGSVRGRIECDGHVTIHKTGFLSGPVRAKGFSVEKGGAFEGELTIGPREAFTNPAASPALAGTSVEAPSTEPRRNWAQSPGLVDQDPLPN